MIQGNQSESTIYIIDQTSKFHQKMPSDESVKYHFVSISQKKEIHQKLENEEIESSLVLIPNSNKVNDLERGILVFTNQNLGMEVRQKISDDLSEVIRAEKIANLGLSLPQIQELDTKVSLDFINVLEKNKKENSALQVVKMAVSGILVYLIFIFIMMYGVRVMRSVLEEKNNRVVEIIISSVKPFELMFGKIFGVTSVALVQFSVWITMILASFYFLGSPNVGVMANADETIKNLFSALSQINFVMIFGLFLLYFLFGYLFYSAMFAAIGSAVDNETETQQFTIFAMIPLLLGMYGGITIMNNPDGPMSFWLSIIPFTSPIAMVARIPFDVPLWEILVSLLLLVISTGIMVFFASKIYRIGILTYGNKASFKDIWKWLKE